MTRVAREIGVFAFFLALSIALTWPLARHGSRFVSDLGDPLLNAWILDWDCYAFVHQPLHLYDATIFAPAKYPLALSENMVGVALLVFPFWLAGAGAVTLHTIATLLGFTLSGYGAYVLARTCRTSALAALAAGVFFAFAPFKFDHLPHVQIVNSGWLPLLLAALLAYWRTPSLVRACLFGAAFIMNGLTNVHYLLFGSLTVALMIAFLALVDRKRERNFWAMLGGALLAGSLILLPFLVPYRIVSKKYGMHRGVEETTMGSAVPRDWLVAPARSRWYGQLADPAYWHPERALFPGLVPIFLAACAFFLRRRTAAFATTEPPPLTTRQRRTIRVLDVVMIVCAIVAYFGAVTRVVRWTVNGQQILSFGSAGFPLSILVIAAIIRCSIRLPHAVSRGEDATLVSKVNRSRFALFEWSAALLIVIGVLGSFGLNAFFHQFLYRYVPIFQSVRAPSRWAVIAYIGLAVCAAMGIDEILRRVGRERVRNVFASGFVALAIIDMLPISHWQAALVEEAPVYRFLSTQRLRGAILELPMSGNGVEYLYVHAATFHHIPIMNGLSGFEPPLHRKLRIDGEQGGMDSQYTALLEQNGCRYVVIHGDWLRFQRDPTFRWLRRELATGRVAFIRRFDRGQNGDWLFAVTRNAPEWRSLRAPEVPDAAGFTPSQSLARFLAGQHVYNTTTFGYVDTPKAWTEVRGPMPITGWALSPKGVKRVIVHFNDDRQQFDAELFPRPDINHYFNDFYPQTTNAGFRFTFPQRPHGVHVDTNFQIEIIDGSGVSTWLPDTQIWWYRK